MDLVPMPHAPTVPPLTGAAYRAVLRTDAPVPVDRDALPSPARFLANNRRPGWDAPSRSYRRNGRTGALTPGQAGRAWQRERV
ncbi:hypothetical protein AAH979_22655 [Plantactinospora sp. ZYX-F-223]|uniref:hypothetical protein n=1 Tax=Plantactinospora sp. ZYX-F-223 TaxID=3144103 RepID=UPI0031FC4011